jgi:CRISPR-associated protein Cas1
MGRAMSYHIVNIDTPQASLSCRDGQLVCKTGTGEKSLPIEDVAAIIITSFSATIHSSLFLQAAKHGVALVVCEAFKPTSLVLPANRSTDTTLSRAQIGLSEAMRTKLWKKTIDAKCLNQYLLAAHVAPEHPSLVALRSSAMGLHAHKEAVCAKYFWQIMTRVLGQEDFTRGRYRGGLNNLLNYGYAVLLSMTLQKLFGVGFDPTFGISHLPRERGTPLAYDLMEPFRPCVDWRVFQWVRNNPKADVWDVNTDFRQWVTGFPMVKVSYLEFTLEIRGCVEGVVRSFRRAVTGGKPQIYKPWTPKDSKWAG